MQDWNRHFRRQTKSVKKLSHYDRQFSKPFLFIVISSSPFILSPLSGRRKRSFKRGFASESTLEFLLMTRISLLPPSLSHPAMQTKSHFSHETGASLQSLHHGITGFYEPGLYGHAAPWKRAAAHFLQGLLGVNNPVMAELITVMKGNNPRLLTCGFISHLAGGETRQYPAFTEQPGSWFF